MEGDEPYVETRLDVDTADLRAATQEPDEHERWDLRFTDIDYRPRPDESEPQRFDYATRVGFGVGVEGHGESTGETRDGGVRVRSGDQRLYAFGRGVAFPMALSARADVHEWYDDAETFRISVEVRNDIVGLVFEYAGSFDVE